MAHASECCARAALLARAATSTAAAVAKGNEQTAKDVFGSSLAAMASIAVADKIVNGGCVRARARVCVCVAGLCVVCLRLRLAFA